MGGVACHRELSFCQPNLTCSNADDQKFIDLAVAHQALLLSEDQHVLLMKKRLLAQEIRARAAM
jgi:predicted nucleic acid-binding protein